MGRNGGNNPILFPLALMFLGALLHIIGFAIDVWSEYNADGFSGSFYHGLWKMCQGGSSDRGCITIPRHIVVAKFDAVRALECIALILYIPLWAAGCLFIAYPQKAWLYTIFGSFIAASFSLTGIIMYGTDYGMLFPDGYVHEHHTFGTSFWVSLVGAILYLLVIVNVLIVIVLMKWKGWVFEDEDDPDYVSHDPPSDIPAFSSVSSQDNPAFTNEDHDEMPDGSIIQSDF